MRLLLLALLHLCMAYDEVTTQLQKWWKHTHTSLDMTNKCLQKPWAFEEEKSEDAWLTGWIDELGRAPGWHSLVSKPRLKATAMLVKAAVVSSSGDIVETGVNAGGTASLIMRLLAEYDACGRKFWGFDSFEGLPNPVEQDGVWGMKGTKGDMAVTQSTFETNLNQWNAWNETRIVVTKGFFSETLPKSPVQKISFLRLDGDIFISTWDALEHLYHRVLPNGYIYVDDYGSFEGCREAVEKFRTKHQIFESMHFIREENMVGYIQFEAVWWRKRGPHEGAGGGGGGGG